MTDKITINTHSSIRIAANKIVYFDPFKITKETHDADIVFVTHSHFDHLSPEDIAAVSKPDTLLVIPESIRAEVQKAGFSSEKIIALAPEQSTVVCGVQIEAVPSYNMNKPMHPKKNGWLGYVITVEKTRIYVAGDMDATPEGKAVQCDIAMIPIGGTYTMNAEEAAELVNAMQPKIAIPTHYGSIVGSPNDAQTFASLVKDGIKVCLKL